MEDRCINWIYISFIKYKFYYSTFWLHFNYDFFAWFDNLLPLTTLPVSCNPEEFSPLRSRKLWNDSSAFCGKVHEPPHSQWLPAWSAWVDNWNLNCPYCCSFPIWFSDFGWWFCRNWRRSTLRNIPPSFSFRIFWMSRFVARRGARMVTVKSAFIWIATVFLLDLITWTSTANLF